MPIVLSSQCNEEPAVVQRAYDRWFCQESVQSIGQQQVYEYSFSASAVKPQLEIFPLRIVEDYFVFKWLVEKWHIERGSTSSTTEMVLCPAYQSIIGMGPKAIAFILGELASEGDDPDHWFWALQVLTLANPVAEEDEGDLRKMSKAWLEWGISEGYF